MNFTKAELVDYLSNFCQVFLSVVSSNDQVIRNTSILIDDFNKCIYI